MELSTLIEFAKAYCNLGGAIQEQLDDLFAGATPGSLNPMALSHMESHLLPTLREIDEDLSDGNEDHEPITDDLIDLIVSYRNETRHSENA